MIKSSTYEAEKTDLAYPLLDWVIDVKTDSTDKRDYVRFAIAQGGWIHRCNGVMVKSIRVGGIDDGAYLPIKKNGTIILKLSRNIEELRDKIPDFDKVYQLSPEHTGSVEVAFGEGQWMKIMSEVIIGSTAVLNSVYFACICIGFWGSVYYSGKKDKVLFLGRRADDDVDQKAVLMPMVF